METVGNLIRRYISEHDLPGTRKLGKSNVYCLNRLSREGIAQKVAATLKVSDYMEHCRERRAIGCIPGTVYKDMTCLKVVLKYSQLAWDMEDIQLVSWEKAKPLLVSKNLIGKSSPRTRRPTEEELGLLLEFFRKQNSHPRTRVPMDIITEFSVLTARRIGETCRIRWEDLDAEKRTCWVRDLKNPKGKGEHAAFPLLGRAWDIVQAQKRIHGEPRIFPYNAQVCSARYTDAKKKLGIKDLRLHDNRREAISRMFERGFNVPEVAQLSLHKSHALLLRVYTTLKPEDLHKGPAAQRGVPNQTETHIGLTGANR